MFGVAAQRESRVDSESDDVFVTCCVPDLCSLQMAGVFLLCTRLKCNMNIKHLWDDVWSRYEFGRPDLPEALAQNSGADVKSVSGKR